MTQVAYAQPWSTSAAEASEPGWDGPCEAWFESLAQSDPRTLIALLESGTLEPHLLTFAAEIAGDVPPALYHKLVSVLTALLDHPIAPVREGALYGLAKLLPTLPHLRSRIERHATEEEASPGVRRAARSILGLPD